MSSRPNFNRAIKAARSILVPATEGPPVNLEAIAAKLGIKIRFDPVPDECSGVALRLATEKIIAVNSRHSYRRQRFTIAHELGHLLLHDAERFVDSPIVVGYRTRVTDSMPEESEANIFAAEILMPERAIRREVATVRHLSLEEAIHHLAARFEVSEQAMTIRLSKHLDVWL